MRTGEFSSGLNSHTSSVTVTDLLVLTPFNLTLSTASALLLSEDNFCTINVVVPLPVVRRNKHSFVNSHFALRFACAPVHGLMHETSAHGHIN